VYKIWMRTSLALGGATSTSSIFKGSPAPQQTAALHLIGFPAVDMAVADEERRERKTMEGLVLAQS
jgi:hypothetical protein